MVVQEGLGGRRERGFVRKGRRGEGEQLRGGCEVRVGKGGNSSRREGKGG